MKDYNGEELRIGDRVRSIYIQHEPDNIGTITSTGNPATIIYDNEPKTEYQILDSRYLIKMGEPTYTIKDSQKAGKMRRSLMNKKKKKALRKKGKTIKEFYEPGTLMTDFLRWY